MDFNRGVIREKEKYLQTLQKQYSALYEDLAGSLSEANKISLNNQIEQKESQIKSLEEEIARLKQRGVSKSYSRPLPPLLTYNLDREDQDFELFQKIKGLSDRSPKPLICLIHGDKRQCHDKFIDCIKKSSLRKHLRLKDNLTPQTFYLKKWPCELKNISHFQERYLKSLSEEILSYSSASKEELNNHLAKYPCPVLIEAHFHTYSWKQHAYKIVTKLLEFWQNWPQLAPGQILLVCIAIKYTVRPTPSLFKLFSCKPIDRQVSESIQALSNANYKQIVLAGLPALEGITEQQVEDWIRAQREGLMGKEEVIDDLLGEIRDQFEHYQSGTHPKKMPMEDVTKMLRSTIRNYIDSQEADFR